MSRQKVTSEFPTAERLALSSRQQDPPHPNKPPREAGPFLVPRMPKPLSESEVARGRGSTNSFPDLAQTSPLALGARSTRGSNRRTVLRA
jgi:hypothetical protein